MVALIVSILLTVAMTAAIPWYGNRRPVGTPFTWGEAMIGSAYVFLLMYFAYGVVPHQWLTLAENEWSWRADRIVYGVGDFMRPKAEGGWLPLTITYRTLSDSIASLFYVVFIGGHVAMWRIWQTRNQKKAGTDVVTSTYGRPLVKQG